MVLSLTRSLLSQQSHPALTGDSSGTIKRISPQLLLQADQSESDGVIIIASESLKNAVDSDAGETDEAIFNF